MQTSASSQVVAVPAPPAPPAPVIVQGGGSGGGARTTVMVVPGTPGAPNIPVPQTRQEYRALEARQRKISSQLTSAAGRRNEVAQDLEKARDPANQNGLQQRLIVLDDRVARLETELDQVGRGLSAAPLSALPEGTTQPSRDDRMGEAAQIVSVVVPSALFFVLAMTAMGMWFKRRGRVAPEARSKAELERLDRLEAAVETIAVEMERVSEGQRFMTRLITEGRTEAPVFGAGARGEALRVPSGGGRDAS
jgi:hypothetical protein